MKKFIILLMVIYFAATMVNAAGVFAGSSGAFSGRGAVAGYTKMTTTSEGASSNTVRIQLQPAVTFDKNNQLNDKKFTTSFPKEIKIKI